MNFMLLTPVNTKGDSELIKTKVLVNLSLVHDISPDVDGTALDFGGDEPVWIVSESFEDIANALYSAQLRINV